MPACSESAPRAVPRALQRAVSTARALQRILAANNYITCRGVAVWRGAPRARWNVVAAYAGSTLKRRHLNGRSSYMLVSDKYRRIILLRIKRALRRLRA